MQTSVRSRTKTTTTRSTADLSSDRPTQAVAFVSIRACRSVYDASMCRWWRANAAGASESRAYVVVWQRACVVDARAQRRQRCPCSRARQQHVRRSHRCRQLRACRRQRRRSRQCRHRPPPPASRRRRAVSLAAPCCSHRVHHRMPSSPLRLRLLRCHHHHRKRPCARLRQLRWVIVRERVYDAYRWRRCVRPCPHARPQQQRQRRSRARHRRAQPWQLSCL
jgi:hypothetical protein